MRRQVSGELFSATVVVGLFAALGAASVHAAEPATLELLQTIHLKRETRRLDHFALDRKRGRLFVAKLSNDSLDIVDLKARKLLKQIPDQKKTQGIDYAAELNRIYLGNGDNGECYVFDGRDYRLLKSIKLPEADNVRYLPSRRLAYVGHAEKTVSVVDAETYGVKARIALPGRPEGFQLESK